MFGYVIADGSLLSEPQLQRYRGCYCGLCRTIGRQYGVLQRAALNYDLTFLVLLLSSLYEPQEETLLKPCIVHPFQDQASWTTPITAYGAAMTVALVYLNLRDDWQDDHSFVSLAESQVFKGCAQRVAKAYPQKWDCMMKSLCGLAEIEQRNDRNPDAAANAFGDLMSELFLWKQDRWTPLLRQAGASLGRFIYLMDAALDYPKDQKRGNYNPFPPGLSAEQVRKDAVPLLNLHLGECLEAVQRLPLLQDYDLIQNILYSGVWLRYRQCCSKEEKHV